jgi:hypothetical protein
MAPPDRLRLAAMHGRERAKRRFTAGQGRYDRSVDPSAQPTKLRVLHLPHPGGTAPGLRKCRTGAVSLLSGCARLHPRFLRVHGSNHEPPSRNACSTRRRITISPRAAGTAASAGRAVLLKPARLVRGGPARYPARTAQARHCSTARVRQPLWTAATSLASSSAGSKSGRRPS